jgi:hypothetical protein
VRPPAPLNCGRGGRKPLTRQRLNGRRSRATGTSTPSECESESTPRRPRSRLTWPKGDAEWAGTDALFAVDFAAEAIDEALYAVLAALRARKDAEIRAASS